MYEGVLSDRFIVKQPMYSFFVLFFSLYSYNPSNAVSVSTTYRKSNFLRCLIMYVGVQFDRFHCNTTKFQIFCSFLFFLNSYNPS